MDLTLSSKIGITAFLIIAGIGYIFGFMNIYLTYNSIDQSPGLSVKDIQIAFWGARDTTQMERSLDGSMRPYLKTDNDYNTVKGWIKAGGKEEDFTPVKEIFDTSCNSCHSAEAKVAGIATVTYEDVKQTMVQDTGKSIPRLVSISHSHILATLVVIFLLALIFSHTSFSEIVKIIVIGFSFFALVIDIGSWWLAKLSPAFAVLVIIGGASLGLSFGLLVVLPLYEIWLKKKG